MSDWPLRIGKHVHERVTVAKITGAAYKPPLLGVKTYNNGITFLLLREAELVIVHLFLVLALCDPSLRDKSNRRESVMRGHDLRTYIWRCLSVSDFRTAAVVPST